VPLYARALELGSLTGEHRRRAVIQMSSSLRNIGRAEEALANLVKERKNGEDHLSDALDYTTALCLSTLGRDREGLPLMITALAEHLPRYDRSMSNYARLLGEQGHPRQNPRRPKSPGPSGSHDICGGAGVRSAHLLSAEGCRDRFAGPESRGLGAVLAGGRAEFASGVA
jgi:tetratricopeptide repeat protein